MGGQVVLSREVTLMRSAAPIVLGVSLLAGPRLADACSCVDSSSCQRYAMATAVFVGDVVDVQQLTTGPKSVRMRVIHVYKGPGTAGETVTVTMPRGSSASCSLDVAPGKRYVVHGGHKDGSYSTSLCQGSYPLKPDEPLPVLPPTPGQVTGQLYRYVGPPPYTRAPIAGALAWVIDGDRRIETRTDADGRFTLASVPQGPRKVRFEVGAAERAEASIDLQFVEDCAEVWAFPRPAARLIGSVLDGSGKPVKDAPVSLLQDGNRVRTSETGPSGAFTIDALEPGSYLVAVGVVDVPRAAFPYSPVFHPGVADRASARAVAVTNETVYVPALRLGPPLPLTPISGEIVCRDGTRPRIGFLTAENLDVDYPYRNLLLDYSSTGDDGRVRHTVNVLRGHRYAIRGEVGVKELQPEGFYGQYTLKTDPVEVDAGEAPVGPLRLVSSLEKCAADDRVVVPPRR
jgi:hypothetical protein